MLSPLSPNCSLDEDLNLEILTQSAFENVCNILLKAPDERQEQELNILCNFMSKASSFQKFWSGLPQDIQREILQELTYTIIKPNKPIFTQGGVAKCFYFILKGSAYAVQTQKDVVHHAPSRFKTQKTQFESLPNFDNDLENESQDLGSRAFMMPFDGSPVSGLHKLIRGGFSSMNSIPNNIENSSLAEIDQGECFGEIVSECYNPRSVSVVAKETCHMAVLSLSVYRRIRKEYKLKIETQRIEFMKNISLVKDWPEMDLLRLFEQGRSVTLQRNQKVYGFGDKVESVYLIKSGEFEMTKEKRLDISDEEVFDKRSVAKQNTDIDRCRLSILNPIWKKRFSTAKKLKVRDALLGVGQCFGEEEVIEKETVRKSKVMVKSLVAEVLIFPVEKIIAASHIEEEEENVEAAEESLLNNATPKANKAESKNTLGSKPVIPSMHLLEQKDYDSGDDNAKEPIINFGSHRAQPMISKSHHRSTSFTSLTPRVNTIIKIKSNNATPRNNPSLVNKLGFSLVDQALEVKENVSANPTPINHQKKKTMILNKTKTVRITTAKGKVSTSISGFEGVSKLWERNVQQYYPKDRKNRNKSLGQNDVTAHSHRNISTGVPSTRDKMTVYETPKKHSVPTIKHMNSSLGFITVPVSPKQVWTPISSEKKTPMKAFQRNASQGREETTQPFNDSNRMREALYRRLGISKATEASLSSNSSEGKNSPFTAGSVKIEGFDKVLSGTVVSSSEHENNKKLSSYLEGSRSPNMSIKASQFKQRVLREPFKPFQPEPLKKSLTIIDMGNYVRGLNQF